MDAAEASAWRRRGRARRVPRLPLGARSAVAAIGAALVLLAPAAPVVRADAPSLDAYLHAEQAASSIPGMAVVVVEHGQPTYAAALGTTARGARMTTGTPVIVGSVGKSMTALAIRQLAAAGRVELDVPAVRYLPSLSLNASPAHLDAMTVQSLLSHTSGLSTADGQNPSWYAPGLTPQQIVASLGSVHPDRAVGSYEYSNLNYVLLGAMVEAVSGQPYGDYLRDHVFGPLGMTASTTTAAPSPDALAGHRYLFGVPIAFSEPYPTGVVPAGYQVSTADDMGRFVAALAAGGAYGSRDLVTGGPASPEPPALDSEWAPLGAVAPGTSSGQSGSTLATNADILVEPGTGRGVVVLLNANPTQLLGLPRGAADIALDVLRLSQGGDPGAAPPTVRSVYLVVDIALAVLGGLLVVHVWRARTWPGRWAAATGGRRRTLAVRTIVADLVLPLAVLVGLPLLVGSSGSTHAGDVLESWRFVLWTLPDLGGAVLVLAGVPLLIGAAKLTTVLRSRRRAWAASGTSPRAASA